MSLADELFAAAAEPARAIAEQSLAERYGDAASALHEVMHMMKMAQSRLRAIEMQTTSACRRAMSASGRDDLLEAEQLLDDAIEAARKALARP